MTQQHPDHDHLLDAGAVLPVGTVTAADGLDSTADTLTARSYRHPGLDGRTVVRLVPAALGPAEDLAVEFLGLTPAAEPVEVGQVRQEALGFPAWALVNDPANGHHALAVVKEMERLARQVKSKPGNAKDGFDELAVRLGRAVPHFLPTYCEQVGRIFLEQGNQTYAGTYFGKAREAERTHSLAIDEERLRAVFLEFALGGALTVKSLRQYVKDLAGRLDAATAWQRFRQLCAERSAAGMAPYAGIAEDARQLIRAAGLDRGEQEQLLLAELLTSPAVGRAPAAVWKSWHGALVDLARRDDTVRARLLEILPTPSGSKDDAAVDRDWLALLHETGADRLLTDPQPTGTDLAARWLRRWTAHLDRGWRSRPACADTVELAARMTERLRTEAVPVELTLTHPTALNLLDLLLAENVPVADSAEIRRIDLGDWLEDGGPGRRDLTAVAADPRFRTALQNAVPALLRTSNGRRLGPQLADYPALQALLVEWADLRADELLSATGLSGASALLADLAAVRPAVIEANPAAAARIAGLDVAALLGHTLRAGILDELGWPALDEALRRLGYEDEATGRVPGRINRSDLQIEDAWPNLILARCNKAVVVGPDGILLEHDLRSPADLPRWHSPRLRFVDGELLVAWRDSDGHRAYWSGRPEQTFVPGGEPLDIGYYGPHNIGWTSLPLPGGGRATGGRVLHAGDTVLPAERPVMSDGVGHWTYRRGALVEYDPPTGALGRASAPPLFSKDGDTSGALQPLQSRLLPMQPGLEHTPLGTDGALLGGWVRTGADRVTHHGVDGRLATAPAGHRHPAGRLDLPGAAALTLTAADRSVALGPADGAHRTGDQLADLTTSHPGQLHAAGTALVPPLDHWHALRPRDEAGSRVLRAVTDAQAAQLLDAAWPVDAKDVERTGRPELLTIQGAVRQVAGTMASHAVPVAAVAEVLPGLTDPLLRAGVAGLARIATDTATRAARFAPLPQPATEPEAAEADAPDWPEHGQDDALFEAVRGVFGHLDGFGRTWDRTPGQCQVLAHLRAVTGALAAPPQSRPDGWTVDPVRLDLPGGRAHNASYHGWAHLLGRTAPIAVAAATPATGEPARAALTLLLTEITQGWLADRGPTLRRLTLVEDNSTDRFEDRVGQVLRHGDRTVVILACRNTGQHLHWAAIEHDPAGEFGAVSEFTVTEERRVHDDLTADWIARFTDRLAQHGPIAWQAEQVAAFDAATGIGRARATLLLAAPPSLFSWVGDLTAEQLAQYDLKSAQVNAAATWLRAVDRTQWDAVTVALLPADPAQLWTTGLAADTAAARWLELRGRLRTLPDEDQTAVNGTTVFAVEAVLNPATTGWIARTTTQHVRPTEHGPELLPDDPGAVPHGRQLAATVGALRWLAYRLPHGSELRPVLPEALAAIRARLADPNLLLDLNRYSTVRARTLPAVLRDHFGLPEQDAAAEEPTACGEAIVLAPGRRGETAYLRPAALTGADDPLLDLLAGLVGADDAASGVTALRALLGDDLTRLTAHGCAADEPAGWPQDPQRSAPALVAEAAGELGLGEDAATLYLQLLALPDPTDRNIARWNGWKPTRFKRARAELAAAGELVLEAKRSRAGRGLFLPGGWQEAKTPGLPVEVWKAGLYEIPSGHAILPHLPAPELFARAWQRLADGDRPGYEQLTTDTRRRGRR
ncbi:hypothetical protein [Kitasatospora sp. CB01950]|uniref:hypothetical protein n=1 Tax=Kitasatospora sp. CB01950 TaxID=1703930 RepID=UPI000939E106|nr:hypothetical protein [Kitasatospora sp. CB01950]OKJ13868.1 hypothetical protein AMK19_10810 [Kitasatospora sp. CB01950]